MRLKSGFVLEEVGGTYLAVAVGERAEEINALIKMNATGAYLWGLMSESDCDCESLAESLAKEYGIDKAVASRDILLFIDKLRESGLLDE